MYLITPMRDRVEFQSSQKWRGWPLVHVSFGGADQNGQQACRHARGIVAIGDTATGLIAVGARAYGIIAIGSYAVGIVTVAGMGLGVFVIAGYAVGALTIGAVSIGLAALGGYAVSFLDLSVGWSLIEPVVLSLLPVILIVVESMNDRRRARITGSSG